MPTMARSAETAAPGLRVIALPAVICAIVLGGCGDGDSDAPGPGTIQPKPGRLSAKEARLIAGVERKVKDYCARVAALVAAGSAPSAAQYAQATRAIDTLAELAREKPLAADPGGQTPRHALGDIAEDLEGSNCDSRLVRRIDEALAVIPAE